MVPGYLRSRGERGETKEIDISALPANSSRGKFNKPISKECKPSFGRKERPMHCQLKQGQYYSVHGVDHLQVRFVAFHAIPNVRHYPRPIKPIQDSLVLMRAVRTDGWCKLVFLEQLLNKRILAALGSDWTCCSDMSVCACIRGNEHHANICL